MGQVIAVVSGKGGTGKTTFVAGVGAALARLGFKTLCLDCDIGLRNLDLALGLSDRTLMDFTDVITRRTTLDMAVVQHPACPNLYLLTAPMSARGEVSEEGMRALLRDIRASFDYCLVDAPAGLGGAFRLATCGADRAVVLTTTDATSLRDAQCTVSALRFFPNGRLHLVVNRVRRKLLRSLHATIDDAIDESGLPLLGVIPEDEKLLLSLGRGVLPAHRGGAAEAMENIALRLAGQRVPLMRLPRV